jgi:hypothetical protein
MLESAVWQCAEGVGRFAKLLHYRSRSLPLPS